MLTLPDIKLRDYQETILSNWRKTKPSEGCFDLSVGSGKTIMILQMIKELGVTATILVHTSVILEQFVEEAKKHWGYDLNVVDGQNKRIGPITVASVASLFNNPQLLAELVANTSALFVDEAHLYVSDKRVEVVEAFRPSYIYGFSGTFQREDAQGPAIHFYFGNILETYEATMINPVVEAIDSKEFIPVDINYATIIDSMVENDSRNTLIAGLAFGEAMQGRKVLVLVKRILHYQKIREKLPKGDTIIMAESDDDDLGEKLQLLRENKMDFSIILGTFSLLSTGFNVPQLDTLVFGGDLRSSVLTTQSCGRILRKLTGKNAKIIDIFDYKNPILYRQFQARKKLYESKNWIVKMPWGDRK